MRKRALVISMVKNADVKDIPTPEPKASVDPMWVYGEAKEQARNAAVAVGAFILIKKVVDTACEVAVITAKARIR